MALRRCAGNAKTARNHPHCSHHQLHNIGHVDLASRVLERRWSLLAAVAAHGWTGGLEEGAGGPQPPRASHIGRGGSSTTTCYTATCGPPVPRPSLKSGIHLSRAEYLSLMHKYLSFPPPGIFVSPIYLYFSYICLGQISVTVQCFYLSHICFSESLSFQVTDKPRFCETLVPRNCSTRICNHSFIQDGLQYGICHI